MLTWICIKNMLTWDWMLTWVFNPLLKCFSLCQYDLVTHLIIRKMWRLWLSLFICLSILYVYFVTFCYTMSLWMLTYMVCFVVLFLSNDVNWTYIKPYQMSNNIFYFCLALLIRFLNMSQFEFRNVRTMKIEISGPATFDPRPAINRWWLSEQRSRRTDCISHG